MVEMVKLEFQADTKGITKAEKELKKLQKEAKKTNKTLAAGKKAGKAFGGALKMMGTAGLGAALGLAAFGKETLASTRELKNLAQLTGLSVEEFQRQAFAAKSVGVEQDKLADIYKDVNDKLGDFVQTGAGPLADFFDGIGKKAGLTAKSFENLSGDKALGLYVKTLQESGASQQEMTFFMEAIASDATLLTPLLIDNARGFEDLGNQMTNVLSTEQVNNAAALSGVLDGMTATVGTALKGAFIDVATEAAKFFNLLGTQEQKNARKKIEELDDTISDLQGSLADLANNEIDGVSASFAELNDIEFTNRFGFDDITDEDASRLRGIMESRLKDAKAAQLQAFDTAAAIDTETEARKAAQEAVVAGGAGSGISAAEELKKQADEQKRLNDEKVKQRKIDADNAKETQRLKDEAEKLVETNADLIEGYRQAIDPQRAYQQEVELINSLIGKQGFTADEARRAIKELTDEQEKVTGEDKLSEMDELIKKWETWDDQIERIKVDGIGELADSMTNFLLEGGKNFKEFAAGFIKQIAAMIIKALIFKAIMDAIKGFSNQVTVQAPATLGAGGPVVDHGGPVEAGQPVTIGTGAQPEVFVPTTNGMMFPQGKGLGGGKSIIIENINVVVKENKDETSQEQADNIAKAISRDLKQMVQGEIVQQQRSGNILNPAGRTTFK